MCAAGALCAAPAAAAPNAVAGALRTWTKAHPATGALVVRISPLGNEMLAEHRAIVPYTPASTMKIVTSAGALLALGPDFRYRTTLSAVATQQGATLDGALYLHGSGDPILASAVYGRTYLEGNYTDIARLVRPLARQGVRRHVGPVVVDPRVFDGRRTGLQWRSYYGAYSPPLSGAPVNQNYRDDTRAKYAGTPNRSTAAQLVRAMRRNGIRAKGPLQVGPVPPTAQEVAAVESPPLSMVLRAMNPHSDNFVAEMMRKSVGAYAGNAGTTAEGNRVTTTLLRDRGLLGPDDVLVDGSGLSRANKVSAMTLVSVLQAAENEPAWGGALVTSLPTGGTGTLVRRFKEPGLRDRVHAKTGYINGVSSLAGVVTSPSGERYAFAFLMNDWDITGARATQDRIVRLLASGRADDITGVPGSYTIGTTVSGSSLSVGWR